MSNSKDHEVAVSGHADTPGIARNGHSPISYPIHHSPGRKSDHLAAQHRVLVPEYQELGVLGRLTPG